MSWRELHVFVRYSPPDSALVRATDPDAWINGQVQLLREVERGIRVLQWLQTPDATRPPGFQQHYPERLPLEADEVQAIRDANPVYDVLPVNEMADWLGWEIPKGA